MIELPLVSVRSGGGNSIMMGNFCLIESGCSCLYIWLVQFWFSSYHDHWWSCCKTLEIRRLKNWKEGEHCNFEKRQRWHVQNNKTANLPHTILGVSSYFFKNEKPREFWKGNFAKKFININCYKIRECLYDLATYGC